MVIYHLTFIIRHFVFEELRQIVRLLSREEAQTAQ
jgi:hypothetical protein